MRTPDEKLVELEERGFTLVEGFLSPGELAEARDALWDVFPRPQAYFADPAAPAHARYATSQFAGVRLFPYPSWKLNRLAVHPDLIDFAERFLGSADLELYKVELWAKYAGAIDYDQPHHRDFGNHTLAVPSLDGRGRQMTTFLLLSDVGEGDGPTKLVPLAETGDIPLVPAYRRMGELFDREVAVTGPAGSLMVYRTDVFHRGSDFTETGRSRFVLLADFQRRGWRWQGKMSWPDMAGRPAMTEALSRMTPRQRDLFGWPPAGSDYWTAQTLRDTAARYPAMDMSPYAPV